MPPRCPLSSTTNPRLFILPGTWSEGQARGSGLSTPLHELGHAASTFLSSWYGKPTKSICLIRPISLNRSRLSRLADGSQLPRLKRRLLLEEQISRCIWQTLAASLFCGGKSCTLVSKTFIFHLSSCRSEL